MKTETFKNHAFYDILRTYVDNMLKSADFMKSKYSNKECLVKYTQIANSENRLKLNLHFNDWVFLKDAYFNRLSDSNYSTDDFINSQTDENLEKMLNAIAHDADIEDIGDRVIVPEKPTDTTSKVYNLDFITINRSHNMKDYDDGANIPLVHIQFKNINDGTFARMDNLFTGYDSTFHNIPLGKYIEELYNRFSDKLFSYDELKHSLWEVCWDLEKELSESFE